MYTLSFLLRRIFEARANNERLIEAITWLTIGCSSAEMLIHAQGLAGLLVCLFHIFNLLCVHIHQSLSIPILLSFLFSPFLFC